MAFLSKQISLFTIKINILIFVVLTFRPLYSMAFFRCLSIHQEPSGDVQLNLYKSRNPAMNTVITISIKLMMMMMMIVSTAGLSRE